MAEEVEEKPVQCSHLFAHCTTWDEWEAARKNLDYARQIGDMAAIPILLENIRWCPNLPGIPPKPANESSD